MHYFREHGSKDPLGASVSLAICLSHISDNFKRSNLICKEVKTSYCLRQTTVRLRTGEILPLRAYALINAAQYFIYCLHYTNKPLTSSQSRGVLSLLLWIYGGINSVVSLQRPAGLDV